MADRMFQVIDKDKKGYITLGDYLCYLDVLMYGTEDEKLGQSFRLLDSKCSGKITFEDFKKVLAHLNYSDDETLKIFNSVVSHLT